MARLLTAAAAAAAAGGGSLLLQGDWWTWPMSTEGLTGFGSEKETVRNDDGFAATLPDQQTTIMLFFYIKNYKETKTQTLSSFSDFLFVFFFYFLNLEECFLSILPVSNRKQHF